MAKTAKKSTVEKTIQQLFHRSGKIMNLDDIINSMTPGYTSVCRPPLNWGNGLMALRDRGTKRELPATGDAVASPPYTEAQHMTIDTNGQMVMKSKRS